MNYHTRTEMSAINTTRPRAAKPSAPITLLLCAALSLVTMTPVAAGMSVKFSKNDWNDYAVGAKPDVKRDFSAPWDGCTGFVLDGKPCSPDGGSHGEVAKDSAGGSNKVLALHFPKGKYASQSGGQFYHDVNMGESGMLEYEVWFPSGFSWTRGGKLPGLYGGNKECSGSKVTPNGKNCFSTRLMWREQGLGELYAYLPFKENEDSFCRQCGYPSASTCSGLGGAEYCAWARGSFRFKAGAWNKVRQQVTLNTPGKADGTFDLYVNGRKAAASKNVVYRTTDSLKLNGMLFSSFFGGDSSGYAPRSDQEIHYRNIKISA